jgi:hypothetical protein
MSTTEKKVRKTPDTVRTAGFEHAKDTDNGTRISKKEIERHRPYFKVRLKKQKETPSTVRTAGYDHVLDTDD